MWRLHLRRQISDPALRRKLVPDYPLGCKRLLFSNEWYPALDRPHVDVVTSPVASVEAHETRPRFRGRMVHSAAHAPFIGYNRAQAAVLEAAILSTRLHMLEPEKVLTEMAYLAIAIGKTAGPREREAWGWIEDKVAAALGPEARVLDRDDR